MMSHPPIPVTDLEDHINMLRMNEGARFSQEYESIEPGQQFTWEMSNRDANKAKNRYANVIAYDHSRVVLQSLDGAAPETSYVNANYMDGYRKHNAYIATQVRQMQFTPQSASCAEFLISGASGTNWRCKPITGGGLVAELSGISRGRTPSPRS